MDFIISLAHFCEVHGPTSILCTQVLPISCLTCYPPGSTAPQANPSLPPTPQSPVSDPLEVRRRPSSEPHTRNPSFSRRSNGPPVSQKSALLKQHLQSEPDAQAGLLGASYASSQLSSPFQTPPASPRSPPTQDGYSLGSLGSVESAARGPSAVSSTSTETCPSCSLSVPKCVSAQLPDGAPGSPSKDGKGKNGSPVLRTREAFIASGIADDRSEGEESYTDRTRLRNRRQADGKAGQRPDSSSSAASADSTAKSTASASPHRSSMTTSSPSSPHPHTLTYLTSRQPPSRDAHSLLRRSCIRTLSCEQLPRANKGPLFFGDDCAGYTISFVFRLPDPGARGRSRRYAFVCWAGREERRAARAYKEVVGVFEGMAGRIEGMVERQQEGSSGRPDAISTGRGSVETSRSNRDITPVSSFLSGRAVDPDGHPRRSSVRARGLAELVGQEDFFVEVHAVFVKLLTRLGRAFGGLPPAGQVLDAGIRGEVGETEEGDGAVAGMRDMHLSTRSAERSRASSGPKLGRQVKGKPAGARLEVGPRQQLVV
ncbi:MAG: hypothetical protein M1832_003110 [Thelocarpon impressellum]|nr:MAG: hypothetical protein M1832_003110 [Thelocarpon impressellum]